MKKLSEMLKETKSYTMECTFKGMTFVVSYMSKGALELIRDRCTKFEYDAVLKQRVPKIDSKRFYDAFVQEAIKGWKNVTYRTLAASGIVSLDVASLTQEELDEQIPFTVAEAAALLESAYDLDRFIQDCVSDFSTFSSKLLTEKDKEALIKN